MSGQVGQAHATQTGASAESGQPAKMSIAAALGLSPHESEEPLSDSATHPFTNADAHAVDARADVA